MPAGRPTDLTPEVVGQVETLMPSCLYVETFADLIGVSRVTIRTWLKRGSKENKRINKAKKPTEPHADEAIYLEFLYAIKKAIAKAASDAVQAITAASSLQWQAAAWLLERRHTDKWGSLKVKAEIAALNQQHAELKALLNVLLAERNA